MSELQSRMDRAENVCEILMDGAESTCAARIEMLMRSELERIHREHLKRHHVTFIDAMGTTTLCIGTKWVCDIIARIEMEAHEVPEFLHDMDNLVSWYCKVSDRCNKVCINDIVLEPKQ